MRLPESELGNAPEILNKYKVMGRAAQQAGSKVSNVVCGIYIVYGWQGRHDKVLYDRPLST